MNVNPNFFISILISIVLFIIGLMLTKKISNKKILNLILILSFLLTLPGISMILYYFHFTETSNWYINFRTIPAIEISISFIGLFLGLLSNNKNKFFLICTTLFLVLIPFIKPILRPLTIKDLTEWKESVCIQSTGATCGPSSLATILKYYNIESTEYELTKNSYTCSTGTEIWYLLRYGKRKGLDYKLNTIKNFDELRYPSIIGTKLITIGHFVTVLGKSEEKFIIGDPLNGKLELTKEEFESKYKLDGLMIEFNKR
jgi:hypothetical protein